MSESKIITLTHDVRSLKRSSMPNTLSNENLFWHRKGERIAVGDPLKMTYDHDTKEVLPVIGLMPERFIISSELEEEAWAAIPPGYRIEVIGRPNNTPLLRRLCEEEVVDVRRLTHYQNPELEIEEVIKKGVYLDFVSAHFKRYQTVVRLFENHGLSAAEDYFYASYILSNDDDYRHYSLGCMLAEVAKSLGFTGNETVPDIDQYIEELRRVFIARVTGAE